jgi:hypothetical protein
MPDRLPSDLLLRGSLITLRRKCGKPSCHCADDAPHETPALSTSVRNLTQIVTLRREDLALVRNALRRYRQAVAELDRKALSGIRLLRRHLRRSAGRERRR